jgi:hypothetical protein
MKRRQGDDSIARLALGVDLSYDCIATAAESGMRPG